MAGRNTLKLDMEGFEPLLRKIKKMDGNVKKAVDSALEQAAETIRDDTIEALAKQNLPAQGRYSKGDTLRSVVQDTRVRWEGETGWVPVGFDFAKKGAGGFLITGTPKMQPVALLNKMYKKKKYMSDISKDIEDVLMDFITGARK